MIATIYTDHIIFQQDGVSTFVRGVDIHQVSCQPIEIPGTQTHNYQTTIFLKGGTNFTFRNGQVTNQNKWSNDVGGVPFTVNDIMAVAVACCGSGSGGAGITELVGDVLAGPGTGSVTATIANGVVTVAKMDSGAAPAGYVATADGVGGVAYLAPPAGDVVGPGSSTVGNFPLFNNTTGDLLSDSGLSPSTIVEEDPGAGIGLIEAAPGSGPIVLKNVRDGLGTQVQANTGSFQTNIHFSAPDVAFVSDALGDPTEVPVSATPAASTIVLSDVGGQIDPDWVPDFVGDSGAGGTNGAVPAPAAGDAAANKFLSADGTWDTAVVAVGDITGLGTGVATALAQNADSTSGFVTQAGADARYIPVARANIAILPTQNGTALTWTAMPPALNFFLGQARWQVNADLTGAKRIRFSVNMSAIVGFAGSKLLVRYRTFAAGVSTVATDFIQLGAGSTEVEAAIDTAGPVATTSGYIDITAAAKTTVIIALLGVGGNGVVSPIFLNANIDIEYAP